MHEAAVGVFDVLLQAHACGLIALGTQNFRFFVVLPTARADAGVVVRDLLLVLLDESVGLDDVRVVAPVFVAGAIATDDDFLHRIPLPNSPALHPPGAVEQVGDGEGVSFVERGLL